MSDIDLEKVRQDMQNELRDIVESASRDGRLLDISPEIWNWMNSFCVKWIERNVPTDVHAELGKHVEAIMKHFKGVA